MIIIVVAVIQCQCSIIIGAGFTIYSIMIVHVVGVAYALNEHDDKNATLIMEIN